MAGMLPGVKSARRRRTHHRIAGAGAGGWSDLSSVGLVGVHGSTRRPAFCSNSISTAPTLERSENEMLGRLAREAKDRLDGRLRAQRTSSLIKSDSVSEERASMMGRELKTEVYRSNKKRLKLLKWAIRFGGKTSTEEEEEEEEDCAVCLEHYKVGQAVVNLPCAHRFHSTCLLPWLQDHALCPCCRMTLLP